MSARPIKQISFRLFEDVAEALKERTTNVQRLLEACVEAYLDNDEHVHELVRKHQVDKSRYRWMSNRKAPDVG